MLSIKTRLLSAEEEFLSALDQGKDAVVAFSIRWESLLEEIDRAMDASRLDGETSGLAHTVALRCATLAEISADLVADCDTIHSHLMGELDSLMSELTIQDPQSSSPDGTGNHSAQATATWSLPSRTTSLAPETCRKRRRSEEPHASFSPRKQRVTAPSSMRLLPSFDDTASRQTPSPQCIPSPNGSMSHSSHLASPFVRKRRHSDANLDTPPLRYKRLCAGPRLHAVSDSFAISRTGSSPSPMSPSLLSSIPIRRELAGQTPDTSTPLVLQSLLELPESPSSGPVFYDATLPDSVLFDLSAPFNSHAEPLDSTLNIFLKSLFKDSKPSQSATIGVLQSPTSSSTPVLDYSSPSTECGGDSRSSSPSPSTPSYPSTPPAVGLLDVESSFYEALSDHDYLHPMAPLLAPDNPLLIRHTIPCTPSGEIDNKNLEKDWSLLLAPLDPLLPLAISPCLSDSQLPGDYDTPPLSHTIINNDFPAIQLTSFFESSGACLGDAC